MNIKNAASCSLGAQENNKIVLGVDDTPLLVSANRNDFVMLSDRDYPPADESFFVFSRTSETLTDTPLPVSNVNSEHEFLDAQTYGMNSREDEERAVESGGNFEYFDSSGALVSVVDIADSVAVLQEESVEVTIDRSAQNSLLADHGILQPAFVESLCLLPNEQSFGKAFPDDYSSGVSESQMPVVQNFFTRALLHIDDDEPDRIERIKFGLVHDGEQLHASSGDYIYAVEDVVGTGYFVLPPVPDADGLLALKLSNAGKAALASEQSGLHSVLQVIVQNADASINDTYPMEVIVVKADSAEHTADWIELNRDNAPAFEWFTTEGESTASSVDGAMFWHKERHSSSGGNINTGDSDLNIVSSSNREAIRDGLHQNDILVAPRNDALMAEKSMVSTNDEELFSLHDDAIESGTLIDVTTVTANTDSDGISKKDTSYGAGLYSEENISLQSGAGSDTFIVKGEVDHVTIKTSDGDDLLSIGGDISNSIIIMGSGNDTVLLNASLVDELSILDGGDGENTLVYSLSTTAEGLTGLYSLAIAAENGQINGFANLILDLEESTDANLDISSLLEPLSKMSSGQESTSIFIHGNASDTITLGDGWSKAADKVVRENGTFYDVYVNTENETAYIQQDIMNVVL